jgi:UDP-N-acetylmuramoylalanine--D-glutamate ligase
MTSDDIVVLELSSFQLMGMTISPDISVITNITPNHLDKHKNMDEYILSKCNIFKYPGSILVVNADNDITKNLKSDREIRYFSRQKETNAFYTLNGMIYYNNKVIMDSKDLKIRGVHNLENICTCLSATIDLIDLNKVIKAIKEFSGVEHRLEFVREINGVKWYNDSVSSSPTRTIAGLNSYDEKIVLIAGGYDKNLDYSPIAKPILEHVSKLILFGNTSKKIYDAVMKEKTNEEIEIYQEKTLDDVINRAKKVSVKGEVVLFSPASASFDMFKNFADRGMQFKDKVNKI